MQEDLVLIPEAFKCFFSSLVVRRKMKPEVNDALSRAAMWKSSHGIYGVNIKGVKVGCPNN